MAIHRSVSAAALMCVSALLSAAPLSASAESSLPGLKDIPQLGLGTWLSDRNKVGDAVEYALTNGYNHVDAAWIYRNEDETGRGIAASGIRREDVWVTSKLWNTQHRPAEVEGAVRKSIADLGVGYLDLYLVHWPVAFVPGASGRVLDRETSLADTWRALEGLVRANLTRHIGVSNFARRDVEAILRVCDICPYAHEFETHPYLQQQAFVDWHAAAGVRVIAYSPLANTNPIYDKNVTAILEDPFWTALAASKNATVPQALLAWGIQRGTVVIPKSSHPEYIEQNRGALAVRFTDEEMRDIATRDKKVRMSNPSKAWGVKLFADLDDHIDIVSHNGADEL